MSRVEVHGFVDEMAATKRLADSLGAPSGVIDLHAFPDGEVLPTIPGGAGGTVVVYRSLHHPNDRLLPLMLAADAYRRAGVARLVLVAPYLCYLRQDAVFSPGQPVSRDVVGRWIGGAFDRVVTVQAHMHRTRDLSAALGTPADDLGAAGALADLFAGGERRLVVGPDEESGPWVRQAAEHLNGDWFTFEKQRLGDRTVRLELPPSANVAGRTILLLDDICSSGGTLEQAIARLRQAGAAAVDIAVAHALFDADAQRRLMTAGARSIVSSDSVPHPTNALELAGLLAAALRSEITP